MVLARADSHRERTAEMTAAYYTGSRAKSHSNSLIWRVSMRDGVIGTQQQAEPHSLIIVHPLIITLHTLGLPWSFHMPCSGCRDYENLTGPVKNPLKAWFICRNANARAGCQEEGGNCTCEGAQVLRWSFPTP
jgi:hypothetical protein